MWTGRKAGKGRKVEEDIVVAETWAWHAKDTENEAKEVGEDMKGEWECNQGEEMSLRPRWAIAVWVCHVVRHVN